MAKTFEQGKDEIAKLCSHFKLNRDEFRACVEAQIRQHLIDPMFAALGWDVGHADQVAPQYAEVVVEESLDDEGPRKAPDYTFRVGTLPKFYAEAKRCGVDVSIDPAPAFQLRRYGWNTHLLLSLLTNFEELGVYDCTVRPRQSDKASRARISLYHFHEYADRWREIWDVFSREAVWSGAFDQYAGSKRKRGTSEVDEEFLKEIEGWRETLARNIALRNKGISHDDLNAAVQLTIDRVVFLRMAEDQGLEPYQQLMNLCDQPGIFTRFVRKLCQRADEKYNAGLFHFEKEAGVSEAPDRITPKLTVDDKVFKPILQSLYFEHGSPYDFRLMPVEILGIIYERFLGKVIRLTAGHQAKVEEKPEVRKAGGVYYTPAYIAQYIVTQTVGVKIADRSPAQLSGGKSKPPFRVLDMACGSGSFLLAAYQCLLEHCLEWYIKNRPAGYPKAVYQDARTGEWRLTIAEKKRILTTHIFGVDIDRQAVDVTKLSLLLKVLEGENEQTVARQLRLFHDRALPNLAENIKCGNSLVGPDYFVGRLLLDPEEAEKVRAFDWKTNFPDAMRAGGFDCIIGNPPYVRIQTMKEWAALEVEIYKELYRAAGTGNYDVYVVFLERGLQLLNSSGRLGFICPHKFFNAKYGAPLRSIVADGQHLSHVVHFGDQQVFEKATTYTCLLFLDKSPAKACRFVKVNELLAWRTSGAKTEGVIKAEQVTASEWNFAVGDGAALFERLAKMPVKLGDIAEIFVGLQTSADTVFVFKDQSAKGVRKVTVHSKELDEAVTIERDLLKPVVRSGAIDRYSATATACVLFPYRLSGTVATLIAESQMKKAYPKTWAYLLRNKSLLSAREHGKFQATGWYQLYPKNLNLWEQPKILIPYMITRLAAYYDPDDLYFVNVTTGGFGATVEPKWGDMRYFTGLLNSRLLDWTMKRISTTFHGGYFAANKQFLVQLPVRSVDFSDKADRSVHDRMVKLVDSMLALHKQLAAAKSVAKREVVQRQIDATDAEIDRLVYGLYGLTDEEIAVVEGGAS